MKLTPSRIQLNELLFNNIAVAVYACDSEGNIVFYNPAAAKLWGRNPDDDEKWCGAWKVYDYNGGQIEKSGSPLARAIKKTTGIVDNEIIVERPDGSRLNVQANPSLLYDEDGAIIGGLDTLIDISEQHQGERKQAMLAAIVESSDDAIISKTLDGNITSWNEAAEDLYGYTETEAIGRHISMIIPEDRLDEETLIINKIKAGEKVDHYVTYRKSKYGVEIPVSLTISPIRNSRGTIIGASKIVRDISRQKASEDRVLRYTENLQTMNRLSKEVSASLEVEDILQKVTDATTRLIGAAFGAFFYNKIDEQGESYTLYTLSGAPKEAFERFGMPRNTPVFHPTFTGEGIIRSDDITKDPRYGQNPPHYGKPEGHLPVVSYLALPVISKSGTVLGGLFYGHPEAARFSREHETLVSGIVSHAILALDNARLYEDIQKLNAKKDEFIGMASHELKTPMTSLSGYLQIIERGLQDGDRNKNFLKKALLQVNKLSELISDLLDVSKIESGTLPLNFSQFDLLKLVTDVAELMEYSTKTHKVILNTDIGEVLISADRQRIEQVLINLVSNAIKYSPGANQVNINVSSTGASVVVNVRDFGIGISREQQERIFSRFYRVDDVAAHISGLGIGLYISKDIINRHNGSLWVESEPGKGSVFSFRVQVKQ